MKQKKYLETNRDRHAQSPGGFHSWSRATPGIPFLGVSYKVSNVHRVQSLTVSFGRWFTDLARS